MTFNNSNRKNIREAEKSAKLAEGNRIAYTKTIMSDLFGRAWMHDLLTRCCMFHSPMAVGFPDATSWNIGKQDIGRRIYDDIVTNCPSDYALMMTEASTKDEANGRRYESGNDSERTAPSTSPGWNAAESGNYSTDNDGFIIDNSRDQARDETGDEAIH